ncbi:hypothetical protein GJ496_001177 [Pomphorhynchus laevis]|nr:hypothetical protein GJ496_001177 [Pomphorhynchus laevis]
MLSPSPPTNQNIPADTRPSHTRLPPNPRSPRTYSIKTTPRPIQKSSPPLAKYPSHPGTYPHPGLHLLKTFGLYCDKEKYGSITENMVLTGIFIGSLLCSVIGDKFGRRPVMLAFFWIGSISGICTALSPTYWFFVLCQFISGLCSQGYGIIAYTMYLELFATSDRAICFLFALVWPLGMLMLGLFSYLATSWQHLYLATSIPMLITFSYYKLVPESIYWLAQQKNDEAVNKVLQKAYRMNKTPDSQRHTYSSDSILVHNDDGVHNNPMLKQKDDHNYFRVWLIGISEIISSFRKRKTFLVVLMISSLLLIYMIYDFHISCQENNPRPTIIMLGISNNEVINQSISRFDENVDAASVNPL